MTQLRTRKNRFGAILVALSFLVLLCSASPAFAQSAGGGFGGAILELGPPSNDTVKNIISATPLNGAFYAEGLVYLRGTVQNCAVSDASKSSVFLFGDGRIIGVYKIWGIKRVATTDVTTVVGGTGNNLTGVTEAGVNMSIDLGSFNGTLQLQGTIGRVFGSIETGNTNPPIIANPGFPPVGHPLTDILAVTGGTGTFRGASGDALLTPLTSEANNTTGSFPCAGGFFQVTLNEAFIAICNWMKPGNRNA
jgi:hypothetical protein